MEANPPIEHIEVHDRVGLLSKDDVVELYGLELFPVQTIGGERANEEDVVHDCANRRYEFRWGGTRKGVSIHFDDP